MRSSFLFNSCTGLNLVVAFTLGISNSHGALAQASTRAQIKLELVNVSTDEAASPSTRFDRIDVNAGGLTIIRRPKESAFQIVIVDTTGKVVSQVGRNGAGPGEVRTPSLVRITENSFSVLDVGTMRITTWKLNGELQTIVGVTPTVFPLMLNDSGFWAFKPMASGPIVNFGRVLSGPNGSFQSLITSADQPLADWFPAGTRQSLPTAGILRKEIVIGDPVAFNFAFYTLAGQFKKKIQFEKKAVFPNAARVERQVSTMLAQHLIKPERVEPLRKNLLAQPVLHFHNQTPLREDDTGRIWALGVEGDSAVAHILEPSGAVLNVPIPCPGFEGYWGLAGSWLALSCAPSDDLSELNAVRMLFRIKTLK